MTAPPEDVTDSPTRAMDPLLDLLRSLHLTGGVFLEAEMTAPWSVTSHIAPGDYRGLSQAPTHVIGYHYITEGRCRVSLDGRHVADARAGDIILVARNDHHDLANGAAVPSVPAGQLATRPEAAGLWRIQHGGGGERTRVLCGFLATSVSHPAIAEVLPPLLTISVEDGAAAAWIESSFRFVGQGVMRGDPESIPLLGKLAELLFIEAVRRHVASLPPDHHGWLAGLRDPVVGRALALLHGQKDRRWTVDELAREAGASRSVFADRFTSLIGEAPIRYLTRHRLQQAADRLRETQDGVADVAFQAGYESEAAFSRAFKRAYGLAPAVWRRGKDTRMSM
jgi:AraC-like DNA-binding protein